MNTDSTPSAEKAVCDKVKIYWNEENTAKSNRNAFRTLRKSKETSKNFKLCSLAKSIESNDLYQDIMTGATVESTKNTEIIQMKIEEYIKKDSEIENHIKATAKLLNDMRIKIEEAHNAACAMSNCFKNKLLPKNGKETKDGEKADVHKTLKDIIEKTNELNSKGQNAFESVVTVSGIQTFTNTQSLKGFMTKFSDAMSTFTTTIEANIASTASGVATCREELNAICTELTQVSCDETTEDVKYEGLDDIVDFICKGKYNGELLDLCKTETSCYDSEGNNGYEGRQKLRSQASQTKDMD